MKKDFSSIQKELHSNSEATWMKRGATSLLALFHSSAVNVPAYKKFLKEHGVNHASIKDLSTFKKEVPMVTKDNYLKKYALNELVFRGDTAPVRLISTSSGSTGVPFFWPRTEANIIEAGRIHELFLVDYFDIKKKKTLFINTFAMGMWVAGTTTYESIMELGKKYSITMITPGIDIEQILGAMDALCENFDQTIIAGYPPFVKDVIDVGRARGVRFKKYRTRFLFAAESFSEEWREHILKEVGSEHPLTDSLNIYGTADALIVAHETPLSILIRKLATQSRHLHARLFGDNLRIPTLAQWNPSMRYFEELEDSKIIFSANSGIPLLRYDIGDTGNIMHFDDIASSLRAEGVDIEKEIRKHGIQKSLWHLPFITIYGRDRMTVSLYGLKIYPEHIHGGLEGREGNQYCTGRFVMATKHDDKKNQYLEIHVELLPDMPNKTKEVRLVTALILKHLRSVNSEFKKLHDSIGDRAVPKIVLHPHQTSSLFNRKGKQKWKE